MVTYTRESEVFTPALVEIGNALRHILADFRCVVYAEKALLLPDTAQFPIELREQQGTKYSKLNTLLETDDAHYFLSLDNDIKADLPNLINLVSDTIFGDYDISWGRVFANPKAGLISKFVDVDKSLSHCLLRPWLWKRKLGITVPGQCFVLKGETYRGKLIREDTFLDDLALGLYTALNTRVKIYQSNAVVVYEAPNETFAGLYQQRRRWGKGYAQILRSQNLSASDKKLVYLHGAIYHGLWIPNLLVFLVFMQASNLAAFAYLLATSFILTSKAVKKVPVALLYQVFFPVFHIIWMVALFQEINNQQAK